jgi:hypothetical protein
MTLKDRVHQHDWRRLRVPDHLGLFEKSLLLKIYKSVKKTDDKGFIAGQR